MNDVNVQTVLVTGGSGYLAGWMIQALLKQGYDVRASIRRAEAGDALLKTIEKNGVAPDRLTFKTIDLLSDVGWDDAVDGCEAIMHVASPMGQGQGKKVDLLTPAREGTLRVLRAAQRRAVKRVVMTSSGFAAQGNDATKRLVGVEAEAVWADTTRKDMSNYARSKILAERAAWDFMKVEGRNFSLTTILPGLILGPLLGDAATGSLEVVKRMLSGAMPAIPRIGFGIVDVRDLVDLHVKAMLSSSAAGQRFLGIGDFLWLSEIAAALKTTLGKEAAKVPTRMMPDFVLRLAALFQEDAKFMAPMLGRKSSLDSHKAIEQLNWHPRPAVESVIDCARTLVAVSKLKCNSGLMNGS
jgi:dihydroflavonol-4-reductase